MNTNKNWEYKRIGDVCTVERGGSPRPIDRFITDDPDGINWIKIGDTDDSMFITHTAQKIIPEGMKKSRYVQPGDFLLSNSMSFGRPYILKIDGCIHDGWLVLRDNDNTFDKRFLYYYLSAKPTYEKFKRMAVGGVVNNLNSEMVRKVDVPLPKLEEQSSIADLLDKVNLIISARKEELKHLDELIKARFVEMFGDPVSNPKQWKKELLGANATLLNGRAYKQDELLDSGKYPVLRVGNFFSNRGWYYSDLELDEDKYCDNGDLLYAWSASFGPRIWNGGKVIYHYHIWKVLVGDAYNKNFLCRLLDYATESLMGDTHGIAMMHLTKSGMEQTEFIVPPIELQEEFANFAVQVDKSKKAVQKALDETQTLFDSLMQKYFG